MKVLVATSLYEAARPYLADWIKGVRQAGQGRNVAVLAAVDGFNEPDQALSSLGPGIAVHLARVPGQSHADLGRHVSSVRAIMLSAAEASDADVVVFCDADDILTPSAIDLHVGALENADVSVGDLQPVDANGRILGTPMMGTALPVLISPKTLAETNVCGFSNTAVRRHALSHVTGSPLPPVIATDWWIFTALLDAGCSAKRADGVVAWYRQHGDNILGSGRALNEADGIRRLRILASHHRARGELKKAEAAERLASSPKLLRNVMSTIPVNRSGPWHADAASWCRTAMEND